MVTLSTQHLDLGECTFVCMWGVGDGGLRKGAGVNPARAILVLGYFKVLL